MKPSSDSSINSLLQAHLSAVLHPRICLFLTAVLFVILFVNRAPPLSFSVQSPSAAGECRNGRVYVYDLPTMFNKELADNCNDSDSYHWRCDAVSNSGFGPVTTGEFSGILPEDLAPAWFRTSQFSLEVLFHNRLLNHRCRTLDPVTATAFYVPFYAGLAVGKYLWFNRSARDWHSERLLEWVKDQPYWRRSNGSDHFLTLGRITWDFRRLNNPDLDWGSSFLNMPGMEPVTRFTIERAPSDSRDVGVPYPTGFHPRSDSDLNRWQSFVRSSTRSSLFCFVGSARTDIKNDFRSLLLNHCRTEPNHCRVADCAGTGCSITPAASLETFLGSDFCLQPRGDSYTRRSVFDCMVAGSVPVFFWNRTAYDQYEWFLPEDPRSYSVFIDHDDVRKGTSIREVLERYSRGEVERMREKVIEYIVPRIVYSKPTVGLEGVEDAFDIAINGVLRRFNQQTQRN